MAIDLHLVYLIIFSVGLSVAAGAAILNSALVITSIRDSKISHDEYAMLSLAQKVVWAGLMIYVFAGVGLFTLSAEAMLGQTIFYVNTTVMAIMVVNAFTYQYYFLPALQRKVTMNSSEAGDETISRHLNAYLVIGEAISVVSWLFIILHHAMYREPVDYFAAMSIFLILLLLVGGYFFLSVRRALVVEDFPILKRSSQAILLLATVFVLMAIYNARVGDEAIQTETIQTESPTPVASDAPINTTFTMDEVRMHSNIEDCWVTIDGIVFDATPAAEKFPEIYICGEDSTKQYRTIRESGISDNVMSYKIGLLGFTPEEVAKHNTKDDCWLIIDDLVFDMTAESKLHPAAFTCGGDSSENYHRNHGEGISERQMKSHIGSVDDGIKGTFSGNPANKRDELKPYAELFVEAGSWDNHELMVVVEKDPEKLLFINGRTHTEVGRIHDIGFQPHTSVFSADGKYMYIIARDGWLTKIDLGTLEPVKSVSVGESSRGTALTDDGKYLVVGNYIPGTIVIVDPESMEILKEIKAVGEIDGKEIESRIGAVIEYGSKVIVALKDLNSVWVIDTAESDFPVIEKHWNIGSNQTPLHDAFLSADGKYYVVASMGSNTVWVMNTETWQPMKEVKTGMTPHTGPGATWGSKVYIPALGEGLITAVDMTTWEPVAHIKTAGPGLFIRSFNEDPEYPYVWTETAFGEFHDEVYVIDARTDTIVETLRPVEGESSWHPEFTNDGKFVYVVSQTGDEVVVYDAWTFEVVKRIKAATPSAVSNVGNRIEELGL